MPQWLLRRIIHLEAAQPRQPVMERWPVAVRQRCDRLRKPQPLQCKMSYPAVPGVGSAPLRLCLVWAVLPEAVPGVGSAPRSCAWCGKCPQRLCLVWAVLPEAVPGVGSAPRGCV
eukprot:359965-Chlamydomonas_euryale.AAC.1